MLIPSVTERSALFVKELSFPQTALTDDAFFNRNWAGAYRDRWAETGTVTGSVRWFWMLRSPTKTSNKRGIDRGLPVVTPMPKLVLSCREKKSTVWRANVLRTFHRWGGLVFIAYVFPDWMVIRILSHWMRYFPPLSLSD